MAEFNFINAPLLTFCCVRIPTQVCSGLLLLGGRGRAAFLAAGENIQKERILPRVAQYAPDQHWVLQLKLPFFQGV